MKKDLLFLLLCICAIVISTESCTKEESCPTTNCSTGTIVEENCSCDCPVGFSGTSCETEDLCETQQIVCQNGGLCDEGICDCPYGFSGVNCESFDPTSQIQELLNTGQSPKALFDLGIPIDSLYGKTYVKGLIFYLNTTDGTGLVAATADHGTKAKWGCISSFVNATGAQVAEGLANTNAFLNGCLVDATAPKICRDLGADWFLPSKDELELMHDNLFNNDHGSFNFNTLYWSSTEEDADFAWFHGFKWDTQETANKNYEANFRAARGF